MPTTYQPKYNTYIGARYVPLIYGEWDNTKQYEPLTVVTYQGNSYTSKTYVPVGVDINNESYWVLSGNYNAQIAGIQEQVTQNTENIATNETNITNLQTTTTNLSTRVTTIENELPDIGGGIVSLRGVKAVLMGDSLNVGQGWGHFAQQASGLDATVYGNGSAGFVSKGNTAPFAGMNFEEMLDYISTTVDAETRGKVQLFLLLGGVNDVLNSLSGINEAVESFMNKVKTVYPNAKYIVCPLHTFKRITITQYNAYVNIQNVAQANGAESSDNFIWLCFGWQEWSQSDQVHLTANGYKQLGYNIASFLNGGGVNDTHPLALIHSSDNKLSQNYTTAVISKNIVHVTGTVIYTPASTGVPDRIVIATLQYSNLYSAQNLDAWQHTFAYSGSIVAKCWCTLNFRGLNVANWDGSLTENKPVTIYTNLSYPCGFINE